MDLVIFKTKNGPDVYQGHFLHCLLYNSSASLTDLGKSKS